MKRPLLPLLVIIVFASPLLAEVSEQSARTRRRPASPMRVGDPAPAVSVHDDFRNGQLGWQPGFADYSPVNDLNGMMGLEARIRALPAELNVQGTGFFFRGSNHSDDLFMFMKKKLTAADGIRPLQSYRASFRILLASNAGAECGGIGGAPGDSVYLKTGATGEEPMVVLSEFGVYRMTVDIGSQAHGGRDASVAGTISTPGTDCRGDSPFMTIVLEHVHPFPVTANGFGELWLLVGTDSGFEGITSLYYQSVSVTLTPEPAIKPAGVASPSN